MNDYRDETCEARLLSGPSPATPDNPIAAFHGRLRAERFSNGAVAAPRAHGAATTVPGAIPWAAPRQAAPHNRQATLADRLINIENEIADLKSEIAKLKGVSNVE
jgi:hypothetical protein